MKCCMGSSSVLNWYGICVALFILNVQVLAKHKVVRDGNSRVSGSRSVDMRVDFEVQEGVPVGTLVGKIPTKPGFTYRFNEHLEYFVINRTSGEVRTRKEIDREALQNDQFDVVVLSSQPTYPIEVRILIKDINDCSPSFPEPQVSVTFPESAISGTRVFLDTAEDADSPPNGVQTGYKIVDGNEDGHFRLVVTTNPSGEAPFLHLETTGKLDRETKPNYRLNISAQDGGIPPRFGFLVVNVSINDVNDCQPVFVQSQYYASLNESVQIGTTVLQVSAKDSDEGENARIFYYLSETEQQFSIEPETGIIKTIQPLDCPKSCAQGQKSCPKSCVFTVFARDSGTPRQDGRAYVTITVVESNHPPVIKFRYFPPTASTANVLESAQNASVVAAISVIDMDEGPNGETVVEIVKGNELKHFNLESTSSFQLVRTNGALDREKIPFYNLTITARDKGNPPCSSTAFLIIEVNNDKDPEISFAKTEYSAVLRESVPIGSYVASITATDETASSKSQVIYSIVSGNEKQWFLIDPRSGLLTTRALLDREQQGIVRLKISARDGGPYPKWAHAQIRITILDENDEHPKFSNDMIELTLSEDVPPGSEVTTVSAIDHDQGINGTITYSLSPQTESSYPNQFHIDSSSGKVITRAKFDREVVGSYDIQVIAQDQGVPVLSSFATIHLQIKDVNDNGPKFYPIEYFFTISEEFGIGSSVGQVVATDPDLGINGQITYKLKFPEISNAFSIEEKSGKLILQENLKKARTKSFQVEISALDGGGKPSEDNAIVNIMIEPLDITEPLKFTKQTYSFSVVEDFGRKSVIETRDIGKIEIVDANAEGLEIIKYTIISGDPNGIFTMEQRSGLLRSTKLIDREEKASYKLVIFAQKGQFHGSCVVTITVTDLNDQVPLWDYKETQVHVNKNAPIGEEIVVMKAIDSDLGANSKITYTLTSSPYNWFSIDPSNGLITLKESLRNSPISHLQLELTATDSGDKPLSSKRILMIHLKEVNNHSPVFDQISYETSLLESTPVNTRFFTLKASDKDAGANAEVNYGIIDGNSAEKFGIFPDGNLYVKSYLDREVQDYFSLTVMATDNGVPQRSSVALFVVHIIDENDMSPKFSNSTFTFTLPENEPIGTYVGKVVASDGDIGRNAELTYSFSKTQQDFSIDHKNGFIKTAKAFDREQLVQSSGQSSISLEVMVHDNGATKLSDKAQVVVLITDVNDETPKFARELYNVQIAEDSQIGAPVVRVLASDLDDQLNGDVFYLISDGNNAEDFQIDDATGLITLRKELDRETQDKYLLTVVAQDMAEISPLRSTTNVSVLVLDSNDCAPKFQTAITRLEDEVPMILDESQFNKELKIIETTPINTELIQFLATDSDLGLNGQITYSLTGGNRHDTFRINGKTGTLFLNKPLDYERSTKYTLTITATDSGSPKLSTYLDLNIIVQDFNDCAPQFPSTSIVRQIQEGISLKTPIVTVTAEDTDSGDNGKIRYSIKHQSPPGNHFGIDPTTGTIHTLLPIDREFADTFRLTIVAEDQAFPATLRLSSEKLVTVIVEDVNDCEPKFTCLNAALLKANSDAMTEIIQISAIDLDSESNGLVTYDIISGDTSLFELNRITGALLLKRRVVSVQPRYQLTIRATDEAIQSQRKSSDLMLMVLGVSEESDATGLRFERKEYQGSIYENEPVASSVITVSVVATQDAMLDSESANIEYYITNITSPNGSLQNRLFDIDVKRGILSTAAILDREMGVWNFHIEVYAILVSARGLYTASTKVHIEVLDINDSPPIWPNEEGTRLSISENAPVGQEIAKLTASDSDITGKTTYAIVEGDERKFMLDANSGVLKIIDTLDRETQEEWKLVVRANDGEQFSDTVVSVMVTDTNDNPPSWNQSAYSFDTAEDEEAGHVIGILQAVDMDKGINGRVTYSILSDWGDDVFSLNPNSGVITLTGKLDYEITQHYIFVVQAQDTGVPSLSSTTTVYLNVLDLNDNSPVFETGSYSVEILESIPVGSSIMNVSATDLDSGNNGKIMYSIINGNLDEAFSISQNGSIYTRKTLDRETVASYQLVVQAQDQASNENQLSSTAQVIITLKDVNDAVPTFVSANTITVMENVPVNSVLLVVKAVDKDEGRNGYVEYILHNEKNTFSLGVVDGLLRVVGNIDRENASNYTLKITAKDRGDPSQSTTQELFIKVRDKNDHQPKFDTHQYSAAVPENSSVGTNVLQVSAFDMDEGLNSQIRYSIIAGDPNQDFSIGDDSGILRVARGLNYERKRSYTLTVQAEDLGEESRYDTATVSITIMDVNDRSPIFLDSPYIVYVRENMAALPQTLMQVNAYDADSLSKNFQVRYLMKEGDKEAFRVNVTTGEITVHRSLDREKQPNYHLTIVAMDTGTPRLTGTGMVQVIVTDQNDCDPVFEHDNYELSMMENVPTGTPLSRVFVTDMDSGLNSVIRYKIQSVTSVPFEINVNTGEIFSKGELDREAQDSYRFNVVAEDSSPIFQKSSTAEVTVNVLDENDNFPKFKESSYSVKIPHNSPSGSYVVGVTATDADVDLNGEIRYFLGGPDADKFQLNETTGVIKTIPALLKSGKSNLAVEVRAVDSSPKEPLSSSVSIKISLIKSDKFPKIRAPRQEFSFPENVSDAVVTTIEGVAASRSVPKFQYFIGGGNVGNAFVVDKRSGQLKISPQGLDFEKSRHYELWVEVCDQVEPEYRAALPIYVNVKDVNDNSPVFDRKHYNVSVVEEEQGSSKLVTTVVAVDKDSGVNGAVRYYLQSESFRKYSKLFEIKPESGEIFSKIKLDREEQSIYTLKIEAADLGDPPKTGTATVTINVEDINDNPMKFTRLFSVNVTENSPVGTFVIQVTSVDKDVGVNANCSYSFTDNTTGKFKIDPHSGNVTVSASLDREVQDEYLLKVSAVDGSWRAETLLTITIEDVNDMAPEFALKSYSFNIPEIENAAVSFVGQVSATDRDKRGPNSLVTYALKHQSDLFAVDPVSGEIFTKKPISYKHVSKRFSPENQHNLAITASDSGTPPLSSQVDIVINVVNANNHPPKFPKKQFATPVLLEMPIESKIIQLQATELNDFGLNAEVEYLKIGGNGSEIFDIERNSGWIVLVEDVSGHLEKSYVLHARAVDKGIPPLSDDVNIVFTVTGPNDHAPIFSSLSYRVIVPENEALGSIIVTLSASDQDLGPNGQVSYNISRGNEQQKFSIDSTSGAVSISKELDYDTKKEYRLIISATDLGYKPRSSEAELTIILTDVNDNPPYFENSVYHANVKENAPLRTKVFTLTAKDNDSPKNSVIRYAIVGGSGKHAFSVDPATGTITSTQVFDYEDKNEYVLDIMATNPDSNLHGTCKIEVQVVGVNEYVPRFVQPVFHFSVSESAQVGHYIGSIQATDEDSGDDGMVYYLLVGSSNDRGFLINSVIGALTVARRLDRESQSRVVLSALAKNSGSIRGNDTDEAQIVINVQDGNDPPVFDKDNYIAGISEDASVGSSVLTVTATDIDVRPSNNRFTYEILTGNHNKTFRIDRITGTIFTSELLDRESIPSYTFIVGAIDTGTPPGIGKATVTVNLGDVNDNAPTLTNLSLFGEILENEPVNTRVMTLQAVDADVAPNGEPFTFSLIGGKDASKFKVDKTTGNVYSTDSFDREATSELNIIVEISDNGKVALKSKQELTIKVTDRNDSPSQPRNAQILIFMKQAISRMEKIASVLPLDQDLVGHYSCRLEYGNEFFTVSKQCDLYAQKIPSSKVNTLSVVANDGRHSEVSSTFQSEFTFVDDSTIKNSIVVRLPEIDPSKFLEKYYIRFVSMLKSIFNSNPLVYSLMAYENGTNIVLAVSTGSQFTPVTEVSRILNTRKADIESFLRSTVIINFSPCLVETQCQNGATCSHALKLYSDQVSKDSPHLILSSPNVRLELSCQCAPAFIGSNCQYRKEPCSPNPCVDGGICIKNSHDFSCLCPSHRQGKRCETEKNNVCKINPCMNGGSCQENQQSNNFFCLCRPGFLGELCQTASNACKPNPCLNGGECISPVGTLSQFPTCKCRAHYFGRHCEKSAFGFASGSFMAFPPLEPNTNDISITFSTNKKNSLVAYGFGEQTGGRSDFVALQLINGKPILSYGGARTAISSISVNKFITDGEWYRVIATRNGRVISLYVSNCQQGGEVCEECKPGNPSCYANGVGMSGTLSFNSFPLLIGGVDNIDTVLERPGQIQTDDFVGCIHSIAVNGRFLNLSTPLDSRAISEECQRVEGVCEASSYKCGSGQCIDQWDSHSCNCNGIFAANCQEAFIPYSFSTGSYVEYRLGEQYKRSQILLNSSGSRDKREVESPVKSLSLSFRTIQTDGVLLYAASEQDFTLVELDHGELQYNSRFGSRQPIRMKVPRMFVSDGTWHTFKLIARNRGLQFLIDDQIVGEELDATTLAHDFLDPYLTVLTLGGTTDNTITNNIFNGFTGCMTNFTINNENQAMNGSSSGGIFAEIIVHGKLTKGCNSAIAGAATAPDPLSIGVTLVIVFFVFLLVAILVSFVVFRMRRREKGPLANSKAATKITPPGQSPGDVVRSHMLDEDEALRNFVRNSKKMTINNTCYQTPDIIERTTATPPQLVTNNSPLNSSLLNSSHGISMDPELPDMPEHYDLENASSIAPSDIDIVYHYKGFRENLSGRKSSPFRHNHHFSGNRQSAGIRQSPISNVLKSTPLARLSPSSELSQQITPRILTLQDISGKPLQSALLATQKDAMSQSERSLNISRSSSRSSMVNAPSQGTKKKRKKCMGEAGNAMNIGLTAEEIERLNNSRHKNNSSLVSTLDDLSSESESHRKNNLSNLLQPKSERRQRSRDTSSEEDESGNDSFSCSEFDYDNEKRGFRHPHMMYTKHGHDVNHQEEEGSFHGSLSTLVPSDDDLAYINSFAKSNHPPGASSSMRWDYLLNWGPNFDNLSGVFKDIAQLPDVTPPGEMPSTSNGPTTTISLGNNSIPITRNSRYPTPRPSEEYV